jgi:hypothetical protein
MTGNGGAFRQYEVLYVCVTSDRSSLPPMTFKSTSCSSETPHITRHVREIWGTLYKKPVGSKMNNRLRRRKFQPDNNNDNQGTNYQTQANRRPDASSRVWIVMSQQTQTNDRWKVNNDTAADQVVEAIKTGYRLFDCAQDYGNEKVVTLCHR